MTEIGLSSVLNGVIAWAEKECTEYRTNWINDDTLRDIVWVAAPLFRQLVREQVAQEIEATVAGEADSIGELIRSAFYEAASIARGVGSEAAEGLPVSSVEEADSRGE